MMKKAIMFGFIALTLIASAMAAELQTFELKTSDYFVIEFEVKNINNIDLRNCVPAFSTSDLPLKNAVTFVPSVFDLPPTRAQTVRGQFHNLSVGYYKTEVNVKCERYFENKIVDVANIVAPEDRPEYEFLVSPAGQNQDYVFIPQQSYNFLANGGELKKATFTIANTGSDSLKVNIIPDPTYSSIITITPRDADIRPGDRQPFTITVAVPENFKGLTTNLDVLLGDYSEKFDIIGEKQTFSVGGSAVAQNLIYGTVSAGNVKLPIWLVILVILGGVTYLYKDKIFKKKKRGGRH